MRDDNFGMDDRDGGPCPECGTALVLREPDHAIDYWACPTLHEPPVVVPAPNGMAFGTALIRDRIVDPIEDYADVPDRTFDGLRMDWPGVDPGGFVIRLCDRYQTIVESHRDRERERQLYGDDGANASAEDDDRQRTLTGWSDA